MSEEEEEEEEEAEEERAERDDDDDGDEDGGGRRRKRQRGTKEAARGGGGGGGGGSGGGGGGSERVIVFASSLDGTHRLTRLLHLFGIDACEFSSAVPPRERAAALESLTTGRARVLVASDAMARGMDIEGVSAVINYDPPDNIKGYVHRVGRTARAGRSGTSYTLLKTPEVHHFKVSMAKAGKSWRPLELPDQAARLRALAPEYTTVLDNLSVALQREKEGRLPTSAPRHALLNLLETRAPQGWGNADGAGDDAGRAAAPPPPPREAAAAAAGARGEKEAPREGRGTGGGTAEGAQGAGAVPGGRAASRLLRAEAEARQAEARREGLARALMSE